MVIRILVITSLVLTGCGAAPTLAPCAATAEQTETVRRQIEQAEAHAVDVFEHGDAAAMAALYTPDAVFIDEESGESTVGRPAIQASFAPIVGKVKDFVANTKEVEVYGDTVYEMGTEVATGLDGRELWRGKYVGIWKRQADGTWLVYRDIFHSDHPATDGAKRTAEVRKQIEDADARMIAAFKRGDLAACVQFYAADAVAWDDSVEHAVHGRAAISQTFWQPMMGKVKDASLTVDEVEVFGSMAYETDHGTWTIDGSPPVTTHGKYLLVWKQQPDGSWLIIRETGSTKTVD